MLVEFPENYLATFTLGYKSMTYNAANDQLKQFHGTKARFDVGREFYYSLAAIDGRGHEAEHQPKGTGQFQPGSSGARPQFPRVHPLPQGSNAPVEAGQATNIVLCMAMQSLREGRRLKWNAAAAQGRGVAGQPACAQRRIAFEEMISSTSGLG